MKMSNADEAYQDWLDEVMTLGFETRRQFAMKANVNFNDLNWAFVMGYTRGQQSMVENNDV
jgi:hypothetical protein